VSDRTISHAGGLEDLPGRQVRTEGQPAGTDPAVPEAYDGLGANHALYWNQFGRDSIHTSGLCKNATVHYGQQYDAQMGWRTYGDR
jgi:Zn-dependent metalloprotease